MIYVLLYKEDLINMIVPGSACGESAAGGIGRKVCRNLTMMQFSFQIANFRGGAINTLSAVNMWRWASIMHSLISGWMIPGLVKPSRVKLQAEMTENLLW